MSDKNNKYYMLEDNVRNKFIGVVWSHKIQEKQADIYLKKYRGLETIKIVCATITSIGIISTIFSDEILIKILSALLSFVVLTITAIFKSFDYQNLINKHKNTANKLLIERDKFRHLLLKIKLETGSVDDLIVEIEKISNELSDVYLSAPQTTDKAVRQASKALNKNKDNTFTEEEIDSNLPESLRRKR